MYVWGFTSLYEKKNLQEIVSLMSNFHDSIYEKLKEWLNW